MYDIYDLPKSIPLGRQGEQYARAVEIDCAKMLHDYPGARLTLMQRRTRGETARIVKTDVSDAGVITWSPDMDAMAVAGLGAIEIVATVDDKVAKSVIAATAIAPSLTPPDTDTRSGWVKDVLDASDAAQGAMAAAQENAAAAAGSASAASKSAASAAGSADAASGSASAAAQSAAEADTSAKASAASAAEAAGSKDAAAQSASAAAASAEAAEKAAQDAAGIIDDAVIAEGKAWSSKNAVDKLLPMQSVTGNPVVIETLEGYPLELSASWEPKQEGSGTPSPDNIRPIKSALSISMQRSGINMLDPAQIEDLTFTPFGLNIKYIGNSTVEIKGTRNDQGGNSFVIMRLNNNVLAGQGLHLIGTMIGAQKFNYRLYGLRTKNETEIAMIVLDQWTPGTKIDVKVQVAAYAPAASAEAYMPYSGQSVALALPRAVCGGTIAPSTGAGQETWGYIASYAGETLPGEWISDRDEYAAGATPTVGAQVAYKLAMPVPFTATGGQTALALAGTNAIITDADTLTVTAPTPPQTTASATEAQAAKLDYVAMMADVDVDDLTAVDDAGTDSGMDMPTDIEGSETDGKQEV